MSPDLGSEIGNGGGIYTTRTVPSYDVQLEMRNIYFSGNQAEIRGGAMANYDSSPYVDRAWFLGNTSQLDGGAISNRNGADLVIFDSLISGNLSLNGAGMHNAASPPELTNVTFSGNRAGGEGSAMLNYAVSSPVIRNSIVWQNALPAITSGPGSNPTMSYSLIQGCPVLPDSNCPSDGGGNLEPNDPSDPVFLAPIDPATAPSVLGDFHLVINSPVIDLGFPHGVRPLNLRIFTHRYPLGPKKSAAPESYTLLGDSITYSFDVENTGNVVLTDVKVTDPLAGLGAIDCNSTGTDTLASLAPAEIATCEAEYVITQADLDAAFVTNKASATAKDPSDNVVSADSNLVIILESSVECVNRSLTIPDGEVFMVDTILSSTVGIDTATPATAGVIVEAPNTLTLLAPVVEFNQRFKVKGDADPQNPPGGGQVRVIIGPVSGFLALGVGTGLGAAGGLIVGSQAGVCFAMETAKSDGLLTAEQIDKLIADTLNTIRSRASVDVAENVEWIGSEKDCTEMVAKMQAESAKSSQ